MTEHWLIENLPPGWSYDVSIRNGEEGFLVGPSDSIYQEDGGFFIPLKLLKNPRDV